MVYNHAKPRLSRYVVGIKGEPIKRKMSPSSLTSCGETENAGRGYETKYNPKSLFSTVTSVTSPATLCSKGIRG
jgi:hypothetical protein